MTDGYLGLYTGPIEVGMTFIWEPNKDHAREVVKVTQITGELVTDRRIWTSDTIWNEESRWREACVRIDDLPATDAQAMQNEKVKALVKALGRTVGYVEWFLENGCHRCGGDCASANPPVSYCPMKIYADDLSQARAALEAIKEGQDDE